MDSRVRAGLFAGAGAAVATFLLSFILFCLTGPFIAAIGGLNAGMQAARDPRHAQQAGSAGAVAGLYAGLIVGAAQILGMVLEAGVIRDQSLSLFTQDGLSPDLYWPSMILFSIIVGVLEVGIMAGCGALGANYAAKRLYAAQVPMYRQPIAPVSPVYTPPPAPEPPAPAAARMPPPPATYPPPPSYYGLPDSPTADAPPDAPTTPAV
jgi:hypothetical protein